MDKFIHLHFFALVFEDTTVFKEAFLSKELWPVPDDCPEELESRMPTESGVTVLQEMDGCSYADAVQCANLVRVTRYLEWKSDLPTLFNLPPPPVS